MSKGFIVPATFHEATASENADEKISALRENETYILIPLPPNLNCIGGRWVYDKKPGVNNEPEYKARYIARGYIQVPDIIYIYSTLHIGGCTPVIEYDSADNFSSVFIAEQRESYRDINIQLDLA